MPDLTGPQPPSPGRIVLYRSKRNPYDIPAVITVCDSNLWPEGVARGDVPALSSDFHVHLHVFTPGHLGSYQEHDIPFAEGEGKDRFGEAWEDGVYPGTWRWPELRHPASPDPEAVA